VRVDKSRPQGAACPTKLFARSRVRHPPAGFFKEQRTKNKEHRTQNKQKNGIIKNITGGIDEGF
jgi:hypothetical protein